MKFLWNKNIFGWRMTGLLGKDNAWFIGLTNQPEKQNKKQEDPRLVSYAPDGSACTLNIGGVEYYYDLAACAESTEFFLGENDEPLDAKRHPELYVVGGAVPDGCSLNAVSSRACEKGTRSCVVEHGGNG